MKGVVQAVVLLLVLGAGPARAQEGAPFKVVVHRSNEMTSAQAELISDYFMKKQTKWPNGAPVKPVDLAKDSPVRVAFSRVVHSKRVTTIRNFWQQRVFLGNVVPPPEAPSDVWVLAYIAQNPGAIGYVSADTPLNPATKQLELIKNMSAR